MKIEVCLVLNSDFESSDDEVLLEKNYQNAFKPLLSFLYSHPDFHLSLSFSGPQLSHYEKKHRESLDLLGELVARKQIEVLGGGYYSPIFPFLFPMDKSGQIEKMTSLLKSSIGKRPHGLSLFGSIWDPSLVPAFHSCGLEYVFLDSTLIPKKNLRGKVLIMEEYGKAVKIFPFYKNFLPLENEKGEDWILRCEKFFSKNKVQERCEESSPLLVSLSFSVSEFALFMKTPVFDFASKKNIALTLPSLYLKNCNTFISSYVPSGMEDSLSKWASSSFEKTENKTGFPLTVYDYLTLYPQNKRLYDRIIYVSMLIAQCKGCDKLRKNAAREKLWEAQAGYNFMTLPFGFPSSVEKIQKAFKALSEAESLSRSSLNEEFKESITSFDYNGDGLNEYVCQMEGYVSVVSSRGAFISLLSFMKNSCDYAGSLSRIQKFDEIEDSHVRGLFTDHLFTKEEFSSYLKNKSSSSPLFSSVLFSEKKFEPRKKEIQFEGSADFSSSAIRVYLRKSYVFSSNGVSVRYVLRNESDKNLEGYFAVELNFAQTKFEKKGQNQYTSELILNGEKKEIASSFVEETGVSLLQLNDSSFKRLFVIEPNEESGFSSSRLSFKRPVNDSDVKEISSTQSITFFWKLSIAPGMEKEKTINMSVISQKNK